MTPANSLYKNPSQPLPRPAYPSTRQPIHLKAAAD